MSISIEDHIRRSREVVAANRAKGNRHAEFLSQLYSDPCRFIEEILQNTEDAYARKADKVEFCEIQFHISDQGIDVFHNGKDFDDNDLMAITTFAGSTKCGFQDVNQIGKFGIGFRSVYSVTDNPEIHCKYRQFRIDDYEILQEIAPRAVINEFETLIRLPFKTSDKKNLYKKTLNGLENLNEYSLLFLKHISCIRIFINNRLLKEIQRTEEKISKNILKKTVRIFAKHFQNHSFIVFSSGSDQPYNRISLCFRLSEDNSKIVKENFPFLFVYFPTMQENPLNFLLHADFTTSPTRENIPLDKIKAPENLTILNESAKLLASSLINLRDSGFLTPAFFEVLPLIPDFTLMKNPVYSAFHNEIKKTLISKKVIPVANNKYAFAQEVACTDDKKISDLIDSKGLQYLFERKYWMKMEPQIQSESLRALIRTCNIKEIDCRGLAFRLSVNQSFFTTTKPLWFLQFYSFLGEHPELWDELHAMEYYSLRTKAFIRLGNGELSAPFSTDGQFLICFPKEGKQNTKNSVDRAVLKDTASANFFAMLGLTKQDILSKDIVYSENIQKKDISEKNPDLLSETDYNKQFNWICDADPTEALKHAVVKELRINKNVANPQPLAFSLYPDIPDFIQPENNQILKMKKWTMEFAEIFLYSKFPESNIQKDLLGRWFLLKSNDDIEKVFVSAKPRFFNRYIITGSCWTEIISGHYPKTSLLLISEAGTAKPLIRIFTNIKELLHRKCFIIDDITFTINE